MRYSPVLLYINQWTKYIVIMRNNYEFRGPGSGVQVLGQGSIFIYVVWCNFYRSFFFWGGGLMIYSTLSLYVLRKKKHCVKQSWINNLNEFIIPVIIVHIKIHQKPTLQLLWWSIRPMGLLFQYMFVEVHEIFFFS